MTKALQREGYAQVGDRHPRLLFRSAASGAAPSFQRRLWPQQRDAYRAKLMSGGITPGEGAAAKTPVVCAVTVSPPFPPFLADFAKGREQRLPKLIKT